MPHTNAFSPAAAWYLPFYLCFVFALCERKNETQKKMKYRCERSHLSYRVTRVIDSGCTLKAQQLSPNTAKEHIMAVAFLLEIPGFTPEQSAAVLQAAWP